MRTNARLTPLPAHPCAQARCPSLFSPSIPSTRDSCALARLPAPYPASAPDSEAIFEPPFIGPHHPPLPSTQVALMNDGQINAKDVIARARCLRLRLSLSVWLLCQHYVSTTQFAAHWPCISSARSRSSINVTLHRVHTTGQPHVAPIYCSPDSGIAHALYITVRPIRNSSSPITPFPPLSFFALCLRGGVLSRDAAQTDHNAADRGGCLQKYVTEMIFPAPTIVQVFHVPGQRGYALCSLPPPARLTGDDIMQLATQKGWVREWGMESERWKPPPASRYRLCYAVWRMGEGGRGEVERSAAKGSCSFLPRVHGMCAHRDMQTETNRQTVTRDRRSLAWLIVDSWIVGRVKRAL